MHGRIYTAKAREGRERCLCMDAFIPRRPGKAEKVLIQYEIMQIIELPGWAGWIAMDADGRWWCYEAEPQLHDHGWYENEVGRSQRVYPVDRDPIDWQLSLQKLTGKTD